MPRQPHFQPVPPAKHRPAPSIDRAQIVGEVRLVPAFDTDRLASPFLKPAITFASRDVFRATAADAMIHTLAALFAGRIADTERVHWLMQFNAVIDGYSSDA